jgi:hypothetical protein
MRILSFLEHDMPPELRIEQVRLQDQAWPSGEPSGPGPWHDQALRSVSMLLVDGARVVPALDTSSKEIICRRTISSLEPSTGSREGSRVSTEPADEAMVISFRDVAGFEARVLPSEVRPPPDPAAALAANPRAAHAFDALGKAERRILILKLVTARTPRHAPHSSEECCPGC